MHRRFLTVLVLLTLAAVPAFANHSWGSYHWGRTSNPFTLKVYDNLTANWEGYLSGAVSDWNQSQVLNLNVFWNSPLSSARKCSSAAGVIEVCNLKYGNNGWLGIAGISISGSHITKAYTKLNDSYFQSGSSYDTPAYRQFVTCQEVGHDFGLDHQDETFANANLGSCMDYTNDPDGGAGGASSNDPDNMHPNQHDYDQLNTIYAHLDSTNTYASIFDVVARDATRPRTIAELVAGADQWGTPVHFDGQGRPDLFLMNVGKDEDGNNLVEATHVLWAPEDIDAPEMDHGRSN